MYMCMWKRNKEREGRGRDVRRIASREIKKERVEDVT